MAKKAGNDNISDGDAHGQESFERVGTLLPKISKEKSQRYRRPLKNSADITIDDIIEDLDEAFNIALELAKPQPAAAVQAALGKAKLLGLLDKKEELEEKPQRKVIFEVIDANHKKPANPSTA